MYSSGVDAMKWNVPTIYLFDHESCDLNIRKYSYL